MARLLHRVGRFSATHGFLVIGIWAAVISVLAVVAVSGAKFSTGGFEIPGTESSAALTVLEEEFPQPEPEGRGSLQLVLVAPEGEAITADDNAAAVASFVDEVRVLEGVDSVSDPFDMASGGMLSADGTAVVATVAYADMDSTAAETATQELESVAADARASGFTAEVGGSLADQTEVPGVSSSEIIGVVIAFVVLLVTLGSLLAAGANLLSALVGVATGAVAILASAAISPIGFTTLTLAVMLGLAVGIDYGLFVLARVRSELRCGRPPVEAIALATGTAGTSVVFAGGTVIVALMGLAVVDIPFITEMGIAGAAGVLVAVLVSLTLLPAMLGLLGRRILPRRQRDSADAAETSSGRSAARVGLFERWGGAVVRRPVVALLGSVALLGVLSVPVLSMSTALTVPGGEDSDSSQRRAYDLISAEFGAGSQSPLVVLAHGDDVSGDLPDLQEAVGELDGVTAVAAGAVNAAGDYAMLTVVPDEGPVDERTRELVHDIRGLDGGIDGVSVSVTGQTAISIDIDARLADALLTYVVLIAVLAVVLLVLLFRSILVPLAATLGFLLSLGASLGVTVAIFQWGWLDAVVAAPQGNPIMSLTPILVVGILFGLAMDYQVFLVSRIHEAHVRGLSAKAAILDGFGRSAFVVVAAALIMFAVFAGFGLSDMSTVAAIGIALGAGVLADAFVVRMVIMPAVLSLTGRAAWWMPRWLDRVLPRVDAEGSALNGPDPIR